MVETTNQAELDVAKSGKQEGEDEKLIENDDNACADHGIHDGDDEGDENCERHDNDVGDENHRDDENE